MQMRAQRKSCMGHMPVPFLTSLSDHVKQVFASVLDSLLLCSAASHYNFVGCWSTFVGCSKLTFWFLLFYEGLPLLGCMQEKVLGCFSVVLCIILIGLKTYMQEELTCALLGWNWWWYLQGSKSNIPCVGVLCWRWFGSIHPAVWQGFWSNRPALYVPVR
jgi:hypothetical protein